MQLLTNHASCTDSVVQSPVLSLIIIIIMVNYFEINFFYLLIEKFSLMSKFYKATCNSTANLFLVEKLWKREKSI